MKIPTWKLQFIGSQFHDGKGTVRELIAYPVDTLRITWKKVQGDGPDTGTMSWRSWRAWCQDEWFEPCPRPLPVPEVTELDRAFPTGNVTPPWRWVPDEFRNKPGGESWNRDNPWVQLACDIFIGAKSWDHWTAFSREGFDASKAFAAVDVTMRNWGQKHEQKMATCGWMLSEWFSDFWFKGDEYTAIEHIPVPGE